MSSKYVPHARPKQKKSKQGEFPPFLTFKDLNSLCDVINNYDLKRSSYRYNNDKPEQQYRYLKTAARTPATYLQNRYPSLLPYDSTLLRLENHLNTSLYVNASYLETPNMSRFGVSNSEQRHWIAAQAPFERTYYKTARGGWAPKSSDFAPFEPYTTQHVETITSFLRIMLDFHYSRISPKAPPPKIVVQLTDFIENGEEKSAQYFPKDKGQSFKFRGDGEEINVENVSGPVSIIGGFQTSLEIQSRDGKASHVQHFHYRGWPDLQQLPDAEIDQILDFIALVLNSATSVEEILVHCSAGVMRTGVFITVATLLPMLSKLAICCKKEENPKKYNWHLIPPTLSQLEGEEPYHHVFYTGYEDIVGAVLNCYMEQRPGFATYLLPDVYKLLRRAWERKDTSALKGIIQ